MSLKTNIWWIDYNKLTWTKKGEKKENHSPTTKKGEKQGPLLCFGDSSVDWVQMISRLEEAGASRRKMLPWRMLLLLMTASWRVYCGRWSGESLVGRRRNIGKMENINWEVRGDRGESKSGKLLGCVDLTWQEFKILF